MEDYVPVDITLTFRFQSDDSLCERVFAEEDNILEYSETFEISLSTSDTVILSNPSTATIVIFDNDGIKWILHCY